MFTNPVNQGTIRVSRPVVVGYAVFFAKRQTDPAAHVASRLSEMFAALTPVTRQGFGEFGKVLAKDKQHGFASGEEMARALLEPVAGMSVVEAAP